MKGEGTKYNGMKTLAAIAITLLVIFVLTIFGNIEYKFDDTSVTAHTAMWLDKKVVFDEIDSVNVRTGIEYGRRISGFGSTKLKLGSHKNSEFGMYSLYVNTTCDSAIVLKMKDGSVVVINEKDETATEELYKEITDRIK